jgi:hypothetical protein
MTFPKSPLGGRFSSFASVASAIFRVSDVAVSAGQTELQGTDIPIDVMFLSAGAAESISDISGGRNGYLMFLIATDGNVTIEDDAAKISLNVLPEETDLAMAQHDILALVNRGGDPDAAVDGYWQELFRTIKV